METVRIEGTRQVKRNLDYYNLDAIIAVGYRVSSIKATKFRQWATATLKEYMEFNKTQKIISDFDKEVQHLLEKH